MLKSCVRVVADVPSPHQNVFFDAVSDLGEIDLEVLFCRRTMPGRAWSGEGPKRAQHFFPLELGVRGTPLNPTLLGRLVMRPAEVTFVNGYYLPALLGAGLLVGGLRRPWIFWMDALEPRRRDGPWLRRSLGWQARQWYLRHATAFLSTGKKGRAALLEAGVSPERAFEIPFVIETDWIADAVDAARTRRTELRRELAIPEGVRLVLYVGQMIRRKGIDLLIDAASQLDPPIRDGLRFLLVGEGVDRTTFERQVACSGLSSFFAFRPNTDNSSLPRFWAAADAFILPSRFDAWGVVVDEALAAGLPVLGSDSCGAVADRVIPGQTGWVFPSGDAAALATELEKFGTCPREQLARLGNGGRALMERYSPKAMARQFTTVVQRALELAP